LDLSIDAARRIHRGSLLTMQPARTEGLAMSFLDKDGAALANGERRIGVLTGTLFCLAALALLAPLMAGEHSGARVGMLLIFAALVQIQHGFRRSSDQARRSSRASWSCASSVLQTA
jgi:hypothetical protein